MSHTLTLKRPKNAQTEAWILIIRNILWTGVGGGRATAEERLPSVAAIFAVATECKALYYRFSCSALVSLIRLLTCRISPNKKVLLKEIKNLLTVIHSSGNKIAQNTANVSMKMFPFTTLWPHGGNVL